MLKNQEARSLAKKISKELCDKFGEDLILVMLFGSTIEGKVNPKDVDLFVCIRNGKKPKYSPENTHIVYYNLEELRELVQGFGRGNPEMIKSLFLGAELLYDVGNYHRRINNAFASGNPNYIN